MTKPYHERVWIERIMDKYRTMSIKQLVICTACEAECTQRFDPDVRAIVYEPPCECRAPLKTIPGGRIDKPKPPDKLMMDPRFHDESSS